MYFKIRKFKILKFIINEGLKYQKINNTNVVYLICQYYVNLTVFNADGYKYLGQIEERKF